MDSHVDVKNHPIMAWVSRSTVSVFDRLLLSWKARLEVVRIVPEALHDFQLLELQWLK